VTDVKLITNPEYKYLVTKIDVTTAKNLSKSQQANYIPCGF